MKFSIVIPVFNVENYIEECVESVLRQTYKDFEVVLINDGSTDRSGHICDQYAKQYPQLIKVIHTENSGQLMARSCGIENASGDMLFFMDSDDYLRANALQVLAIQIEKTNCDMVLFNASASEDFSTADYCFEFEDGYLFENEKKKQLYDILITTSRLNPLWLKVVQRNVALAVPKEYRCLDVRNAGDLLYATPMMFYAKRICYLNQNLYYYRQRTGSIVHTYNPVKHRSIKIVHQEMEKYIDRWGMQEYHPKHFAREVRGWVDCLKKLLVSKNKIDEKEMQPLLKELAEDEYFRNAYQKMATDVLTKTERILARWLYEKKYAYLRLTGFVVSSIRRIKK